MNLLGALFRGSARAKESRSAGSGREGEARKASRVVHIRVDAAQMLLKCGPAQEISFDGPLRILNTADGVLVTQAKLGQESAPMCQLELPEGTTADLQLDSGTLTVHTFKGTLRARVMTGNVSVEKSEGNFRVAVPTGRVRFEQVRGEIDVLTNNASVIVRRVRAGVQAVSSGGPLELEDIDGPLVARTTNGAIEARDLRGPSRLSTRTGGVSVTGTCGELTVRSQGGQIRMDGSITAHTRLETHTGGVELKLGTLTNANIEARVAQGMVRFERISPSAGSNRRVLRTTMGLGEARVRLISESGLIDIAGPQAPQRAPRRASLPH